MRPAKVIGRVYASLTAYIHRTLLQARIYKFFCTTFLFITLHGASETIHACLYSFTGQTHHGTTHGHSRVVLDFTKTESVQANGDPEMEFHCLMSGEFAIIEGLLTAE